MILGSFHFILYWQSGRLNDDFIKSHNFLSLPHDKFSIYNRLLYNYFIQYWLSAVISRLMLTHAFLLYDFKKYLT